MNDAADGFFRENPSLFQYPSLGIDESADPCVCRPCNEDTILNGPEDSDGEVLVGSRGPSEPGIIGEGDQKIGAFFDKLPAEIRKDNFKADENPELALGKREIDDLFSGFKIPDPFSERAQREDLSQGHKLSKGNEMDFVVSSH